MNLFWDEILSLGGNIAGVESYDPELTDFADPIKKLVGLYYDVPKSLKTSFAFDIEDADKTDPLADDFPDIYTSISEPIKDLSQVYFHVDRKPVGPLDTDDEKGRGPREMPVPIVDFDALFIPDASKKAALIIPHLAYYDIEDIYLLGTNLWHSENLPAMSRSFIQDAIMTDGFFAAGKKPHVVWFSNAFEKTFGEKPGFIEAVAYDSASMLFQTLLRPDIRFKSHLKDALLNLVDFQGVTGFTSFNYKGDVIKRLYVLRVRGHAFEAIQTP
jgi:hypothetical protein